MGVGAEILKGAPAPFPDPVPAPPKDGKLKKNHFKLCNPEQVIFLPFSVKINRILGACFDAYKNVIEQILNATFIHQEPKTKKRTSNATLLYIFC